MHLGKKDVVVEEWGLGMKQIAQRSKDEDDFKIVHEKQRLFLRQPNLENIQQWCVTLVCKNQLF